MKTANTKMTNQQLYAFDRISSLQAAAIGKLAKPTKTVVVAKDVQGKLAKIGLEVTDNYYLSKCLRYSNTAKDNKAKNDYDKQANKINSIAQEAKDQIMLGDNVELTTVLAKLAKALGV